MEEFPQAVWHDTLCAVVFVVVSLNATAAGDVIATGGNLQVAPVRHFAYHLHKTFPIGAASQNDSTIHILQTTAHDLSGRSSSSIYHYHDRHHSIHRFAGSIVLPIHTGQLPFGKDHFLPFGDKEIRNVDRLAQSSSWILPQVQHQTRGALSLQIHQGLTHLTTSAVGEPRQINVAHSRTHDTIIRNLGHLDGLTGNLERQNLPFRPTLHTKFERSACLTSQHIGNG